MNKTVNSKVRNHRLKIKLILVDLRRLNTLKLKRYLFIPKYLMNHKSQSQILNFCEYFGQSDTNIGKVLS